MLDPTAKKVLKLLHASQPVETRCAAATVLGELGTRDAEIAAALADAVDDPAPELRRQAMQAVGKLRVESALPRLLPRISAGGPESETAAQAAARLGAKGMKAVRDIMAQAAPGLRRRLAGALAASGSAGAETAALDALLDKDPGVVDAATRSLLAEVPTLSGGSRKALTDRVLELLNPPKGEPLAPASETALVRVLAGLGGPRGEEAFWERIDAPHPADLRAAALQALGRLPPPENKDKLKRLFACLAAPDFRVAAPALMILRAVPVGDRSVKEWLPLFDAPDAAVRRFAIEKIADRDSPEIAAALLKQLRHADRGLRDTALAALTQRKHGRAALAQALLGAETPDEAWSLARAQAPHAAEYPPALRAKILQQAQAWLEEGDRRADALLFLPREVDAGALRDQLEERALALRKKKNYAAALAYLRYLGRDPACAESLRFEAAACGLRLSERDLAAESRAADPCLQQFARLIHGHETDPAERLRQAKWLEPEDLFYLGFHFAEQTDRREHAFGGEALKLLIQRSPRSKLAKDARSKLRSLGLD
jgi:HEAT repeat protein